MHRILPQQCMMLCQEVQFGRAGRGGLAHTVVATISEPFADGRSNAITFPPLQQPWLKSHVKKCQSVLHLTVLVSFSVGGAVLLLTTDHGTVQARVNEGTVIRG